MTCFENLRNNLRVWILGAIVAALSLSAIILVGVWMSHYYDGYQWKEHDLRKFNFHPLFMTIAFIGLSPIAALVYRLFPAADKFTVKIVHFLLQLTAISFAIEGLLAVIQYHNDYGYKNFYSVHSWCGLVTFILFSLQLIVGFVSFLFPKLPDVLRAKVVKWHAFFGTGIVLLAILTTITGVSRKTSISKLNHLNGQQVLANCLTLVLITLFGLMLVLAKPKTKHRNGYEPF